ncbi:hypothetical protein B0G73_127105 [Paraburkholderia sp. BL25I1N1]|nr:hypothetical protein B0G73_127105 [Paraburkholderia sp. BL25I1N1]
MSLNFQQQPALPTPRKENGLWMANVRPARKHLTLDMSRKISVVLLFFVVLKSTVERLPILCEHLTDMRFLLTWCRT